MTGAVVHDLEHPGEGDGDGDGKAPEPLPAAALRLAALTRLVGVTGATGAHRRARRDAPVPARRPSVSSCAIPARAPLLPGAEVRRAAYCDGAAVRDALTGVETVFLVSGAESAERVDDHRTFIDAAVEAGVVGWCTRRSSARAGRDVHAGPRSLGHRAAPPGRAAGLDVPAQQPLPGDAAAVRRARRGAPRPGGRRARWPGCPSATSRGVAALVLREPGRHDGQTYELSGPQALHLAQVAEIFTFVTGRQTSYHDETVEEAYASRAGLAPDWEVEGWVTSYTAIAAGELDVVTEDVLRLAGHEPGTLGEWLAAHPDALR